jgi:hypothetical protein
MLDLAFCIQVNENARRLKLDLICLMGYRCLVVFMGMSNHETSALLLEFTCMGVHMI